MGNIVSLGAYHVVVRLRLFFGRLSFLFRSISSSRSFSSSRGGSGSKCLGVGKVLLGLKHS